MSSTVAESKATSLRNSKGMIFDEENKRKNLNLGKAIKGNSVNWRQDWLLHSNLSLNASSSSEASTDSFVSRASTGRIRNLGFCGKKKRENVLKMIQKGETVNLPKNGDEKRRCSWVTPNTDPSYIAFHDEEWGVPVHDDKKLFELLVLSSKNGILMKFRSGPCRNRNGNVGIPACRPEFRTMLSSSLSELSWPTILSKRRLFREVFMDFDPKLVSELNVKKIVAAGSTASSLLSEPKLRAIIENSRHVLKIVEEFGSFDQYCWNFVNQKPIANKYRYARHVPVKTPKADTISKDLMRRGFRSVGPIVIYSFMQVAGLTNDHLTSCFRFHECANNIKLYNNNSNDNDNNNTDKIEGKGNVDEGNIMKGDVRAVDELNTSYS